MKLWFSSDLSVQRLGIVAIPSLGMAKSGIDQSSWHCRLVGAAVVIVVPIGQLRRLTLDLRRRRALAAILVNKCWTRQLQLTSQYLTVNGWRTLIMSSGKLEGRCATHVNRLSDRFVYAICVADTCD